MPGRLIVTNVINLTITNQIYEGTSHRKEMKCSECEETSSSIYELLINFKINAQKHILNCNYCSA